MSIVKVVNLLLTNDLIIIKNIPNSIQIIYTIKEYCLYQ